MDRKQWIMQRLEYLDYLAPKLNRKPLKNFSEWVAHTITALNKVHSEIHVRSRRLKDIIRNLK